MCNNAVNKHTFEGFHAYALVRNIRTMEEKPFPDATEYVNEKNT